MQDHTLSLSSFVGQALGVPLGAIPLSSCHIRKPYLLEKQGIDSQGTAILFAVPYVMARDVSDPERNLSLYAVPRDYHRYFEDLAADLIPRLKVAFPPYRFALFADHSPIDEVDAAARCGLGVIGDNGLLLTAQFGSFVFIGEIVTNMPYEIVTDHPRSLIAVEPPRCEGCGACISACPEKCLPNQKEQCLSALTQKKGDLSERELVALSNHSLVWGCDICQMVCPHNQEVMERGRDTPVDYFRHERLLYLNRQALDEMDDQAFRTRAYAWRGKSTIRRNLTLWEERRKK
ncbi:MAG: hypothetical protein E7661_04420 [Ruminococcaceae bacterium]|nr:hypothetical protein [Oscillospiraceae bacterium]